MPFRKYTHIESTVTAALLGADTVRYVTRRLLAEAKVGRLQSFSMEVGFGDSYTFTFRYRESSDYYTLTMGDYLIELNDGSLITADAETFTAHYQWEDPATTAVVGLGVVGQARLTA